MSAPSNEWRSQPIGYAPTDDTGSFLHRTHIDISKLPGGASCRTYCSKDVNLQGYSIFRTSTCWCYTTKYDISMYDSFGKYSGSKKPIHAWNWPEPGFNGYQLFKFSVASSCSACPTGTMISSLTSVPNDETSCQLCERGKCSAVGSSLFVDVSTKQPTRSSIRTQYASVGSHSSKAVDGKL